MPLYFFCFTPCHYAITLIDELYLSFFCFIYCAALLYVSQAPLSLMPRHLFSPCLIFAACRFLSPLALIFALFSLRQMAYADADYFLYDAFAMMMPLAAAMP